MPYILRTDPNRVAYTTPFYPPVGRDAELVRRVRKTIDDLKEFEAERHDVEEGEWLLTSARIRRYRLRLAGELRAYRLARRRLIDLLGDNEDFVNQLASGNL